LQEQGFNSQFCWWFEEENIPISSEPPTKQRSAGCDLSGQRNLESTHRARTSEAAPWVFFGNPTEVIVFGIAAPKKMVKINIPI